MPTIAERLLAGEHHGCATWHEVAARFGCDPKALYLARKALEARGTPAALQAGDIAQGVRDIRKPDISRETKLPESGSRWPSVEAFDTQNEHQYTQNDTSPVVPPHHAIAGVSTHLNPDGSIKSQWVKTSAQNDERAAWLEAIRSLGEELPRYTPIAAPAYLNDDLCAVYPVGDPHAGQLSWHEDAGDNFDLEIAEQRLVSAFGHLIALAPPAAEALVIFIGDNTHADGQANTTTRGTRVDVDGRMVKVARTFVRIARRAVDAALAKHGHVTLVIERGNHDELISAMLALALSIAYEDDERVTVDVSPEMFHWFRFGANLIGTHHGDKVKPMDLLGVMAVDRADDWSATRHRRFYLGHYHHQIVKEVPGLICEYLPTLASSDAWHRSMGYRSGRAMYMDVLHREHGHINRHIVGVGQLAA